MSGNIKALTETELEFVLSKYDFKPLAVEDDLYVIVTSNNRKTIHHRSQPFSLLLPLERKRIKITIDAIDRWSETFNAKGYSLIEVQNAINVLKVTCQTVDGKSIAAELQRMRSRLDNLFREGE